MSDLANHQTEDGQVVVNSGDEDTSKGIHALDVTLRVYIRAPGDATHDELVTQVSLQLGVPREGILAVEVPD